MIRRGGVWFGVFVDADSVWCGLPLVASEAKPRPTCHGNAPRMASVSASKALYSSILRLTEDITRIESTTCTSFREADFAVCPALPLQGQRIPAASY